MPTLKHRWSCYNIVTATTFESYPSQKSQLVETAIELIGSPSHRYISDHPERGQSPKGFDCSGFVRYVLQQSGFVVPDFIGMDNMRRPVRHANEFWDHYGAYIQTSPECGDLLFFTRHGLFPTHIGIVVDEESYVHAPGHDGTFVGIEPIEYSDITAGSSLGRMLFKTNPIGFKAPTIPVLQPTYRYHQQLAE